MPQRLWRLSWQTMLSSALQAFLILPNKSHGIAIRACCPPVLLYLQSSFWAQRQVKVAQESSASASCDVKPYPSQKLFTIGSNVVEIPCSSTPDDESSEIHRNLEKCDDPRIGFPLEKLFVPPDVDVPTFASPLSSRILKGSNIVLSNYAKGFERTEAEFIKSSRSTDQCPTDGLPEFALVGRSNVGKSSLLNSLVRRKKLALTSKKPGKTQCINHFRINGSWYLVDLPGYGYAAAPQEVRTDWIHFTREYFLHRENLVSVFLLIDASIPAKKIDLEYASWLGQNQIPMTVVFTKCDKRKKKKRGGKRAEENVEDFQKLIREFFDQTPPWIMTSSVTNQGRDEMLLHMAQLRNYWLKH